MTGRLESIGERCIPSESSVMQPVFHVMALPDFEDAAGDPHFKVVPFAYHQATI